MPLPQVSCGLTAAKALPMGGGGGGPFEGQHLGLKISCGANGSKGPLTADALAADFPFLGGLTMHGSAQSQPCRQESVCSNGGEQGTNEAPVGNQVSTHLHPQSFQGLLTHLQSVQWIRSLTVHNWQSNLEAKEGAINNSAGRHDLLVVGVYAQASVVDVGLQLPTNDMIALDSHELCSATASHNPASAYTCAASVQDRASVLKCRVTQRVADLADARYFAQGQGLHKLLESCGVIRQHILAVGLVDIGGHLGQHGVGSQPYTAGQLRLVEHSVAHLFSNFSTWRTNHTTNVRERGNIVLFEGATQRSLRSGESSQWLWKPEANNKHQTSQARPDNQEATGSEQRH